MKSAVLHVPFPDEILIESGFSEQGAVQKMQQLFVIDLYVHHQITSGKGAEILGIRKYDFIRLLSETGVNYFDYTGRELDSEFSVIDRWEGQHG
jgi:predicted HTH domain antitoxin